MNVSFIGRKFYPNSQPISAAISSGVGGVRLESSFVKRSLYQPRARSTISSVASSRNSIINAIWSSEIIRSNSGFAVAAGGGGAVGYAVVFQLLLQEEINDLS